MFFLSRLITHWPSHQMRAVILAIISLSLASCTLIQTKLPTEKPAVVDEINTDSSGMGQSGANVYAEDPDALLAQANSAPATEVPGLLIRAANAFLDRNQVLAAKSLIPRLESFLLPPDMRFSAQVIRARVASKTAQHAKALDILKDVNLNQIRNNDINRHIRIVEVVVQSQIALGAKADAVASLLAFDPLVSDAHQLENQRRILNLVQSLEPPELAILRSQPSNTALQGWLALSETINKSSSGNLQSNLQNWRNIFRNHPAQSELLEQYAVLSRVDNFRQVALLLPLTSPYGNAARAFHDGFMAAHNLNSSYSKPQVLLYDIGEEASLSKLYYEAAENEGADFIVGPLGKSAAKSLISSKQPKTDTLMIAEIPEGRYSGNLYGISLSPENEARQTARHAFADGHRYASVFRVEGPWGQRVADAFMTQWEALGGIVVKNSSFPKGISDYTQIIQRYLGLNKSMARHKLVQSRAGSHLKFTPRRNNDLDFIFLAANSDQARIVVPQLRFFHAHNVPIYATSYVYSGHPNPAIDADLDGLVFGEMEWLLEGVGLYQNQNTNSTIDGVEKITASNSPYLHTDLDRLYALGVQSYQMIPRLSGLRIHPWSQFAGDAMTISVDSNGNVVRHPIWVEFKSGLIAPIRNTP